MKLKKKDRKELLKSVRVLDLAPADLEQIPHLPPGRKCTCHGNFCIKGVKPPENCVCRLAGIVSIEHCEICKGRAWFEDERCTNCRRKAEEAAKQIKSFDEAAKVNPHFVNDFPYKKGVK